MRFISIKTRMTMWYTFIMIIIVSLVLTFMLVVSNTVVANNAEKRLLKSIQEQADEVDYDQGVLDVGEFDFYRNSVYLLVYDTQFNLIAGAGHMTFDGDNSFKNAVVREVQIDGEGYLVYDLYVPNADGDLWLRGIISTESTSSVIRTLVILSVIIFPVLVVIAAVGGWFIANHAFKPIRKITETADAISDGSDLSARIGLKRGRDEVHKLGVTIDRLLNRLESSFNSEKRFAADASHELRTPTAVILAECEYARHDAKTIDDYRESIEVVERQANKMSALINQLLSLTRMDQNSRAINLERASISELTDVVCDEIKLTDQKGITLTKEVSDDVFAMVDVGLMTRLVQNLVCNAYKYTPEGGHITVSLVNSPDDKLTLSVKDDGVGIAPENIDKIWSRFWQADASRGEDAGAGLGLSMVKQISDTHGGTLSVRSEPGKGSEFTFSMRSA